jgi:hypothetical protein
MLILRVDDADTTHSLTVPGTVSQGSHTFLSCFFAHLAWHWRLWPFACRSPCVLVLLFLIFWWIPSLWCSFLYEFMMNACCMWPARFDKIPPFSCFFLSLMSLFHSLDTLYSLLRFGVTLCLVLHVNQSIVERRRRDIARLQIVQKMNTNL